MPCSKGLITTHPYPFGPLLMDDHKSWDSMCPFLYLPNLSGELPHKKCCLDKKQNIQTHINRQTLVYHYSAINSSECIVNAVALLTPLPNRMCFECVIEVPLKKPKPSLLMGNTECQQHPAPESSTQITHISWAPRWTQQWCYSKALVLANLDKCHFAALIRLGMFRCTEIETQLSWLWGRGNTSKCVSQFYCGTFHL